MALKGKLAEGVLPRPSSPDEDEILLHETDLLVFSGVSISTDDWQSMSATLLRAVSYITSFLCKGYLNGKTDLNLDVQT